jgi:fructokinase
LGELLSRSRQQVLAVGYLVLDVVDGLSLTTCSAGGTAGNVAANTAWLGLQSGLVAHIGKDPAGDLIVRDLVGSGVNVSHLYRTADVVTPVLIHRIDSSGKHQYLFKCPTCGNRFASHRPINVEQAEKSIRLIPDMIFSDRVSLGSLAMMEKVQRGGGLVFFEPNRPGREHLTRSAVQMADILKISSEHYDSLSHLIGRPKHNQIQIRTLGADGAEYRIGTAGWRRQKGFETVVVDPGGAGDWVTAGFILRLLTEKRLDGSSIANGLRFGQNLAAISCAYMGARGLSRSRIQADVLREIDGKFLIPPPTLNEPRVRRTRSPLWDGCSSCVIV